VTASKFRRRVSTSGWRTARSGRARQNEKSRLRIRRTPSV